MSGIELIECSYPYDLGVVGHCGKFEITLPIEDTGVHTLVFRNGCVLSSLECDLTAGEPIILDAELFAIDREIVFSIYDPASEKLQFDLIEGNCKPCEESTESKCFTEFKFKLQISFLIQKPVVEVIEEGENLTHCG